MCVENVWTLWQCPDKQLNQKQFHQSKGIAKSDTLDSTASSTPSKGMHVKTSATKGSSHSTPSKTKKGDDGKSPNKHGTKELKAKDAEAPDGGQYHSSHLAKLDIKGDDGSHCSCRKKTGIGLHKKKLHQ